MAFSTLPLLGSFAEGNSALDIVGVVISAVSAVGVFGSIIYYFVRSHRWRSPLVVTYLIPQETYAATTFPGAPQAEEYPTHLTVGVGKYLLIHYITAGKADATIGGIQLEFQGPALGRPKNRGVTAPMVVSKFDNELGDEQYEDWHGITHHMRTVSEYPKPLIRHTPMVIGHLIETDRQWVGMSRMLITIQSRQGSQATTVITDLAFYVTDDPNHDQIHFLKR